jgi:serine/threonine protein kinase
MSISAVRQGFESFAAGLWSEAQLRAEIRAAIEREPHLVSAYVALVSALGRGQVIGAELEASILTDIGTVSGAQLQPPAAVPAGSPSVDGRTVFKAPQSARSAPPGADAAPGLDAPLDMISSRDARPIVIDEPIYADPINADSIRGGAPGSSPATGSPTGSAAGVATGPITGMRTTTGTGTGTGSSWDTPERLAEPAVPLVIGSLLKNRFELLEELGRGGMGVVYKALDRTSAEFKERSPYVAIKVLNEEFKRHPLAVRSLQREARKAQKLAHPNIVTVFDFDRDGGNVYMVMELLTGHSLDQLLRREASAGLPLARVSEIVTAMGAALSNAHEQGIVHADFKPSNVFITDAGVIKVLDFGVARAIQSLNAKGEKTVFDAGQLGAFSPPYASLQMLNGEAPDPRDDVYALACVTYELLTGRHPFNRIDALKARDAGLRPVPPKHLSRSQWQGLRQGLAFKREERSASVEAFVSSIFATSRARSWWPLVAALVLLAVLLGIVLPRQWSARQAGQLSQRLLSQDPAVFSAALASLRSANEPMRARALANEAARKHVIDHYDAVIAAAAAAPDYDFARARTALGELSGLLPDSRVVADMAAGLDAASQAALQRELAKRDAALANGVLIAAQGPDDLSSVLGRIRRIDPSRSELRDPRVIAAYLSAARSAGAASQSELADKLLQAGLLVAPNDAALLQAKAAVDAQLQREADARRVSQLEQRLGAISPTAADFLDQVLANRDDFSTLAALAPSDAVLMRLQGSLQSVVMERVRRLLAQGDIAGARKLLLDIRELLPEQVAASANAAVLQAARVLDDQALDTLDRLRRAVLTGRLVQAGNSGALDLYASLQRSGASPDIVAQARDLLAYGYLHQARSALAAGDSAGATASLTAARAIQPSTVWQARIRSEQQLLEARAGGGARSAAPNGTELDAVRQQFADTLRSSTLGSKELQAIADELDRLEALGSSPQELDSGLRQVEDRVISEVTRVQGQSGVDQAQLYAGQASETLLASERIAEVARQLRSTALGTTKAFSPDILAARDQLSQLLAKPEATQRWADELRSLLQKLSGSMASDDASIEDARRSAVAMFVKAAADARTQQHLPQASSLLAIARQIDPQSPDVVQASAEVAAAQSASDAAVQSADQRAGIELLKQKLAAQALAGDVAGANATANALRRVLAGSLFVSTELPEQIIQAYVHSAKSQALAGNVDAALQTLATGRKKFGTSPELKNLELRYVTLGDAYDRLSSAVVLNVEEQRHYLESLRASEGSDFPEVQKMLARTLANRIADTRAANRPAVAAKLLESGQSLFPDYASLLEQGKAGVLANTPLAVIDQ